MILLLFLLLLYSVEGFTHGVCWRHIDSPPLLSLCHKICSLWELGRQPEFSGKRFWKYFLFKYIPINSFLLCCNVLREWDASAFMLILVGLIFCVTCIQCVDFYGNRILVFKELDLLCNMYVDFHENEILLDRNIRENDVSPISCGCLHKGGQVVRGGELSIWTEVGM